MGMSFHVGFPYVKEIWAELSTQEVGPYKVRDYKPLRPYGEVGPLAELIRLAALKELTTRGLHN